MLAQFFFFFYVHIATGLSYKALLCIATGFGYTNPAAAKKSVAQGKILSLSVFNQTNFKPNNLKS